MKNLLSAVVGLSLLTSALAFAEPVTVAMPANGTSLISAGFTPDPILVQMTVSGTYDVTDNAAMAAEGCIGSINPSKPDYRIVYSGAGTTPLILAFSADQDGADTALVLNDPEGDWLCVDDASAGNLNPVGTIGDPLPGTYDVWVSVVGSTTRATGKLIITEMMQEVIERIVD